MSRFIVNVSPGDLNVILLTVIASIVITVGLNVEVDGPLVGIPLGVELEGVFEVVNVTHPVEGGPVVKYFC